MSQSLQDREIVLQAQLQQLQEELEQLAEEKNRLGLAELRIADKEVFVIRKSYKNGRFAHIDVKEYSPNKIPVKDLVHVPHTKITILPTVAVVLEEHDLNFEDDGY